MKKKGHTRIKKPNGFLYGFFYLLIYPLMKLLFHLEVNRTQYHPPKGPFIVVSNHQSFMDFLLTMLTIYPHRLNAVAAQKFFFYRPLNWLMPLMGAIPKNLFDPDMRSVLAMMEVIKRGDRLLLFPEGRCTTHGPYMGMHRSTGKLIKKLGVPVLSCRIEGAYTCMPFWRKGIRRGQVRVLLADLFSTEDTQALSVDEINSRIDARLSGEDVRSSGIGAEAMLGGTGAEARLSGAEAKLSGENEELNGADAGTQSQAEHLGLFKAKRLAEGLENILYYCPKCQREFTLQTTYNTIRCTACGSTATMSRNAELISGKNCNWPKTVAEWYKVQVIYEMQFLYEDMEPIKTEVIVKMPLRAGRGPEPCGQGKLSLDSRGWRFEGELRGEDVQLFFPIETVPAVPFDPKDDFQIYAQGKFYMFTPKDNPQACVKYATIGECAYWRFASNIQMTVAQDSGFCE